jgi:hypothetical protein
VWRQSLENPYASVWAFEKASDSFPENIATGNRHNMQHSAVAMMMFSLFSNVF